jgi:superfamily II DNA helicase RecQ
MAKAAPKLLSDTFHWLMDELREKKDGANKYIIYCRSIAACGLLYDYLDKALGAAAYIGKPSVKTRLFAMFHHSTRKRIKKIVLDQFGKVESKIRVVIATVCYGMGIDVKDVHMVIQWGCPRSMEEFYQEAGRAGRNPTMPAYSLLYYHGSDASERATDSPMHQYCKGKDQRCRRQQLINHFDSDSQVSSEDKHRCCDVCVSSCNCDDCPTLPWIHLDQPAEHTDRHVSSNVIRVVDDCSRENLQSALQCYKDLNVINDTAFISGSLLTGITDKVINDIVMNVQHIHQVEDLLAEYVYITKVATDIMDIIDKTLD